MSAALFDSAHPRAIPARRTASPLLRRARIALRRHTAPQFLLLLALWWVADAMAKLSGLPLPGSILGLFVLLALLGSGALPASWLRRGAMLLLGHLMLFFVPAMLALLDYPELLSLTGLKLVGVILLGTLSVMSVTALLVEFLMRRGTRHA